MKSNKNPIQDMDNIEKLINIWLLICAVAAILIGSLFALLT